MTILHTETNTLIDVSSNITVLTYIHPVTEKSAIVLSRVELGNPNPIAGGGTYVLTFTLNGAAIAPASSVDVPAASTHTFMQSREVTVEAGDVIVIQVLGDPTDTTVSSIAIVQDITPIREEEFDAILDRVDDVLGLTGAVIVNHDYGTPGSLTYETAAGVPVSGADIYVYRASDYNANRRGKEFVIASAETTTTGEWNRDVMLDPGEYVLFYFKSGEHGPDVLALAVT